VLSFRGLVHTPESLFEEDALLYGPVSKHKPPKQEEEARVPQNWFPIFNSKRNVKPNASYPSISLKITLQRSVIPNVTRILQQIMTKQDFLFGEVETAMILELGEDGFKEYTSNIFLLGIHTFTFTPGKRKRERDVNLLESGYIESIQHILKDVSGIRDLKSTVRRETLKYSGLLDYVAEYQGKLCVIDWKTSEKPKLFIQNTFDSPLQVVAYMSAVNHDPNYSFQVQCGLIVVAYKDGSPDHSHVMDAELCSHYWVKWLLRLEEYTEKNKNENMQKTD
uniref:Mitochondrial genome maintenance exonuclease 1 n=1 Tax=Otolemur garnettii TaxID=30611 RepID=H0XUY0_OTOGA